MFFPSAEYQITTRITTIAPTLVATRNALPPEGAVPSLGRPGASATALTYNFKTEGKVLVKPGWLAIYGKEAADEVKDGDDKSPGNLVPVKPGVRGEQRLGLTKSYTIPTLYPKFPA